MYKSYFDSILGSYALEGFSSEELMFLTPFDVLTAADYLEIYKHFVKEGEYLTTKEGVINALEEYIKVYTGSSENCSDAYKHALEELLTKLLEEIKMATLFNAPVDDTWGYMIDITTSGAKLKLVRNEVLVDEYCEITGYGYHDAYTLISVSSRMLSPKEYAEIYGVKPSTVRQWIKRGKICNAIKNGNEWLIPELIEASSITDRGYKTSEYSWRYLPDDIPEAYAFMKEFNHVVIMQKRDNKQIFKIQLDFKNRNNKTTLSTEIEMSKEEKEKFELFLISCNYVKAKAQSLDEIYSINF